MKVRIAESTLRYRPRTVTSGACFLNEWSWDVGAARYISGTTPFPIATSRASSPGTVHTTAADPNETADPIVDTKRIRQSARTVNRKASGKTQPARRPALATTRKCEPPDGAKEALPPSSPLQFRFSRSPGLTVSKRPVLFVHKDHVDHDVVWTNG